MIKKGKLAPELLQKIKDSINILEVVGEHVVLKKSGANYTGLCPFHSERTPSFSVSESKQLYHCYGCRKGGDLVTFVMEILGVSFPEAIEELADRSQVKLPQNWNGGPDNPEQEKERSVFRQKLDLAYKLNRFSAAFFHHTLGNYPKGIEYCLSRGVNEDIAKAFYIGAVTDSWDTLVRHLIAKKAPLDLAVELGLIRPSTKGSPQGGPGFFDLFRNRILFPILNQRGRVAGFGGRVLGEETPKYLNSPDSIVFQKGKLAYGLYQAQKHIREKDEVILVEGYFDVLVMHAAGFQNVVATCGTALTPDHLAIFKRFASKVTVLFDGDKAGVAATERAMEIGLDAGQVIFGAQMPLGMDPDELLFDSSEKGISTDGRERMNEILKNSVSLIDARIEEQFRYAQQSPEQRTQAIKKIGGWLTRFQDSVGREVRIEHVVKEMGISRQLLNQAMGGASSSNVPSITSKGGGEQKEKRSQSSSSNFQMTQIDRALLRGIAQGGEFSKLFAEARGNLPPRTTLSNLIEYPPAKEFIELLLSKPGLMEQLREAPDSLLGPTLDVQVRSIFTEAGVGLGQPIAMETFKGALLRSLARNWARFSQRIKTALAEAEVRKDAHQQTQLMKEYLDVQRKMKDFSNFYDEE